MHQLIRLMLPCALSLLTALPAAADQPNPPPVPTVTSPPAPADHQTYTRRAEADMQAWRAKLDGYMNKAGAAGTATGTTSKKTLQEAWEKVKAATGRLETAGSDTWEGAKHAYEASSKELVSAWNSAQRNL